MSDAPTSNGSIKLKSVAVKLEDNVLTVVINGKAIIKKIPDEQRDALAATLPKP